MVVEQVRSLLAKIRRRLGHFRTDEDLREEMELHLEMQAEENRAIGIPEPEARRRAHASGARPQTVVEGIRDHEFMTTLEGCYRDVVIGIRTLRKTPVFCLTAVLTIALGIGANTAVFTLIYGLLLRGLPVPDADRLARIGFVDTAHPGPAAGLPYRMVRELPVRLHSFSGIAAWSTNSITMEDSDGVLRLYTIGMVGGDGLSLLGVRPHLGRLLTAADDIRGGPPHGWTAVLSYGFWQDRFGGDAKVIGRSMKISGTSATIVGVAPRQFAGVWPGVDPKFYVPMQFANVVFGRADINAPEAFAFCSAIGRLKPGVSISQANAELAVDERQLLRELVPVRFQKSPGFATAGVRAESARTGLPSYFGRLYSRPLFLMQGLVGVVLLLCCVNVSGLMVARVHERRHEFAVRTAIGAARQRLVRQYLTESFLVAAAGASLGGVAAWYGSGLLLGFFRNPMQFTGLTVQPDMTVFLVSGGFAVLTTLLFGTLPALRAGRGELGTLLKSRTATARLSIAGRASFRSRFRCPWCCSRWRFCFREA